METSQAFIGPAINSTCKNILQSISDKRKIVRAIERNSSCSDLDSSAELRSLVYHQKFTGKMCTIFKSTVCSLILSLQNFIQNKLTHNKIKNFKR